MSEEELVWYGCLFPSDVREDLRHRYFNEDLHRRYADVVVGHGAEFELTEERADQLDNEVYTANSRVFAGFVPEQYDEIAREKPRDVEYYLWPDEQTERGRENVRKRKLGTPPRHREAFVRYIVERSRQTEGEMPRDPEYYLKRGEEAGLTHEQLCELEEEMTAAGIGVFAKFVVNHVDEIRWTKPPKTDKDRQELRRIYAPRP